MNQAWTDLAVVRRIIRVNLSGSLIKKIGK